MCIIKNKTFEDEENMLGCLHGSSKTLPTHIHIDTFTPSCTLKLAVYNWNGMEWKSTKATDNLWKLSGIRENLTELPDI